MSSRRSYIQVILLFLSMLNIGITQETDLSILTQEIARKGVKKFIKELDNTPSQEKVQRIKQLAVLQNIRLIKPIADKFLNDKNETETVRIAAAFTLGEMKDSGAIKPLSKALKKDVSPNVRSEAAVALGKIGTDLIIKPLSEALLKDEDSKVKMTVAEELVKTNNPEGMNTLLSSMTGVVDKKTRITIIKTMGIYKEKKAVEYLNSLVELKNLRSDIRREAVKALAGIMDPSSIPSLKEAFQENLGNMQKEVGLALCQYGIGNLMNAVHYARTDEAKQTAHTIIVKLGDPVIDQLYEINMMPDYIISALAEIGTSKAIDRLSEALKSKNDHYRKKILDALVEIGSPAIPTLVAVRNNVKGFLAESDMFYAARQEVSKKLKMEIENVFTLLDYSPSREEQAKYHIMNLNLDEVKKVEQFALTPAIELLSHEDSKIRINAIKVLEEMKDSVAVRPLIQMLNHDKDDKVRIQAAAALGALKDSRSVDPLILTMKTDEKVKVKEEAAKALGAFNDEKVISALLVLAREDSALYNPAFGALLTSNAITAETVQFYERALQIPRGYTSHLRKAAKLMLNTGNVIPGDARDIAVTYLEKYTTIREVIHHDRAGRPIYCILKNADGDEVAKRRYKYGRQNSNYITSEVILDIKSGDEIHITRYDAGKPIDPRFLCLDNNGDIIKIGGKAATINQPVEMRRSHIVHTEYNLGAVEKVHNTYYPIQRGASVTGVKGCKFVW